GCDLLSPSQSKDLPLSGGSKRWRPAAYPEKNRRWRQKGRRERLSRRYMSPRMNPQATDRFHFEAQLAYARPVVALLAALCLVELRRVREIQRPLSFLIAYLVLAIAVLWLERTLRGRDWHLPLACDVLVLGIFLWISPLIAPVWFLLFFVAFAGGYHWNLRV